MRRDTEKERRLGNNSLMVLVSGAYLWKMKKKEKKKD